MGDSIAYNTGAGYQKCGIATVENTDRIRFVGATENGVAWIDLSHGHFAPGATPETQGLSEIEISVATGEELHIVYILGTDGSDSVVCAGSRVELNADDDSDLRSPRRPIKRASDPTPEPSQFLSRNRSFLSIIRCWQTPTKRANLR